MMKKRKAKELKVLDHQTGMMSNKLSDVTRVAMHPGKRLSKTGKVYWETRKNRSDKNKRKRL
jgi:hypothetical protein